MSRELNIENLETAVAEMWNGGFSGTLSANSCHYYAVINKNYHCILAVRKDDKRNLDDLIQIVHRNLKLD